MMVALSALFIALGGVGYAATTLPANSVGRAQIRNNAVNYLKIAPGSVGIARINPRTVQARVLNTCTTGHAAIAAIDEHGQPICKGVLPSEFDTSTANPVKLGTGTAATSVASELLTGETSYLVMASPYIKVTGATGVDQQVEVSCSLGASPQPGNGQTRSQTFDLSSAHQTETGAIPLVLTEAANFTQDTARVSCTQAVTGTGAAPVVEVSSSINALQTGGNTTEANAG
jgi:hypothetical protein